MANISINVIGSSSKGNCIILNDGESNLILDFGVKSNIFDDGINKFKISLFENAGCLITHRHHDHIQLLKEKFNFTNFYLSNESKRWIKDNTLANFHMNNFYGIVFNKWYKIKNSNWKFKAIKTYHNCLGSCCFIIKNKKNKILYLTDTRYFENKNFKKCTHFIVESNYGAEYIEDNYKNYKHLSNNIDRHHMNLKESVKIFEKYVSKKTKIFIFSHLSSEIKDLSFIESICEDLENAYKINVKYLNPNKINFYSF